MIAVAVVIAVEVEVAVVIAVEVEVAVVIAVAVGGRGDGLRAAVPSGYEKPWNSCTRRRS
ncbi:hypothetical protein [Streptomyces sp. NPDC048508]|uniref:hypothetical protein n=1 Tax=Streptomyces sp. NPDC048508 TaxID=3365561 RepID=UPI003714F327